MLSGSLFNRPKNMVNYLLVALLLTCAEGILQPRNCGDIYKSDKFSKNGTYQTFNQQQQSFNVYCDFHMGYGYTYVDPSTNVTINIADLFTDPSHVLIRDMRSNGHQYVSQLEQITAYKRYNLSVQFNAHAGYALPLNAKMLPYLYVGFLPASVASHRTTQGYRVNGVDRTFRNCDANPNSYFAFLFNHNRVAATPYNPTNSQLVHVWDTTAKAVPTSNYLPRSYFSYFELHFGGCGGYATAANFPGLSGAALGLRYDMMCSEPPSIPHATKTGGGNAVGSVVTYVCDIGYTLQSGDATRRCIETGEYTGTNPICGQLPCDSMPCVNGGSCFADGSTYICECREGYAGQRCELIL